ncbi:MAG: efflux RND transporter permease subunit [Bdellovibrionales bacterium]|nr:efflux RND transporter permease subunit [Bdellovibrionales bacterium]
MNLARLSISRPIFITCVVLLSLVAGFISIKKLGVDLFPDVTFPVVTVTTAYPGAGPSEIETLVSKPLEDEISTLSGIKRLSSVNQDGVSQVIAEFTLETDIKYAEQQMRDRVSSTKRKLPKDIKEPIIRRIDPSDQPILIMALNADLPPAQIYDLAEEVIKPKLEQVNQVGLVEVLGGRKREIQVALDRTELKRYEISALQVADRIKGSGEDIPSGKKSEGEKETVFRTVGQFHSLSEISNLVVNFFGNEKPIRISDVGKVLDTLEDEKSRTFLNDKPSLFLYVFKQSGSNTIAVVDGLLKRMSQINSELEKSKSAAKLSVIRDGSRWIRINVEDVYESILIGAVLAMVVVFLFLANGRSTLITGLALPNSLIGAFILMALFGFTINVMSLLALSLSVGLLIDDAIVVRENIFRHIEMGKKPIEASLFGTNEVTLAVIATTLTVVAVFGPLGFLKGVTGQFFKQFGLTVCFAMLISLFDALTVAPMLSAYFAGQAHGTKSNRLYDWTLGRIVKGFSYFQDQLDVAYEKLVKIVLRRPFFTLGASFVIFIACVSLVRFVPKTFLPAQDAGEFSVGLDLPPGYNLESMTKVALEVSNLLAKNPQVETRALVVGNQNGDPNEASIYVHLVPYKQRPGFSTSDVKEIIRQQLKPYAYANPAVKDYDAVGGGMRPFNLNIYGSDSKELEKIGLEALAKIKKLTGLKDVDINFRSGKPEFRIVPNNDRAHRLGVSTASIGNELRIQVEGLETAKYRESGIEYDVRVRLQEGQRNLSKEYNKIFVPNLNNSLVRLSDVAESRMTVGPSKITRQDRNRFVQINADITPGAGLDGIMKEITGIMVNDFKLPESRFAFVGQAENFKELGESMAIAMMAGILFIYLVLASLYESFVTPFTIMLALPLAIAGSFVALFLGKESLNIFSMIGIIMLLGVAVKNSILLVDYANQKVSEGVDRAQAILMAGRTRLRPILMTTMALIAGTIPIAVGLNEASKQRTSMGVAIIGGLLSSTLLTLVVVPAAYIYIDRFRVWSKNFLARIFIVGYKEEFSTHKVEKPRDPILKEKLPEADLT